MLRFAAFATALCLAVVPILTDPSYYAPYGRVGVPINGSDQGRNGAIRRDPHYDPPAGYDASPFNVLELPDVRRGGEVRSNPLHPWRWGGPQ